MNAVHVHLLLNHIPVLGVVFGAVVLAVALYREREVFVRFALWLFIAMAVLIVPTYLSGESAEDIVEPIIVNAEPWIDSHEDAAGFAGLLTVLLGALAAGALAMGRGRPQMPRAWVLSALVMSLLASAALARTATLGGQISHTEIRGATSD